MSEADKASAREQAERSGRIPKGKNRMPADSGFYERIVPLMLVALGLVTLVLVLIAAGILLGFVRF